MNSSNRAAWLQSAAWSIIAIGLSTGLSFFTPIPHHLHGGGFTITAAVSVCLAGFLFFDLFGIGSLFDYESKQISDSEEIKKEEPAYGWEQMTAARLNRVMSANDLAAHVVEIIPGRLIVTFEIEVGYSDNDRVLERLGTAFERETGCKPIRVVKSQAGSHYAAIEIPNPKKQPVRYTELRLKGSKTLALPFGLTPLNEQATPDLAAMPHLLVAGTTGAGKTVLLRNILYKLAVNLSGSDIAMTLIDLKGNEFVIFAGLPHVREIISAQATTVHVLNSAVVEMNARYQAMADKRIVDIEQWNQSATGKRFPYRIIVIDELADIMSSREHKRRAVEAIQKLTQKGRAAGFHVVLATQRPSVETIPGEIKANIKHRICFYLPTGSDSRTVLDSTGAEKLHECGDCLYFQNGRLLRVHTAYKPIDEITAELEPLRIEKADLNTGPPLAARAENAGEIIPPAAPETDIYERAKSAVIEAQRASIPFLTQTLRISKERASKLLKKMVDDGIVTDAKRGQKRKVLKAV